MVLTVMEAGTRIRIRLARFVVPSILLLPFLQSLSICPFPLPWIVCSECPVFSCLMNPRTTPIRRMLLAGLLASGLLVGRAFCSWACPFGALQEIASTFFGRRGGVNPRGLRLRAAKIFALLVAFFIAFGLAYPILLGFLPKLLCQSVLDQVYTLSVTLNSFIASAPSIIGSLRAFTFASFLGLCVFLRRTWCKVCPLGTSISLFNKLALIGLKVDRNRCDCCSRCSSVCQMSLKPQQEGLSSIDCVRCLGCYEECSRSAIGIKIRGH